MQALKYTALAVLLVMGPAWGRPRADSMVAQIAAVAPSPDGPVVLDLAGEWQQEYDQLTAQLANRGQRAIYRNSAGWWGPSFGPAPKLVEETAHRSAALVFPQDRDPLDVVLRRTGALLEELEKQGKPGELRENWDALRKRAQRVAVNDWEVRKQLFREACRLRRKVVWANPLLNFDRILFIKKLPARYYHICDQFFGTHAAYGGGLYVLSWPFGENPVVKNLLAEATVGAGRFQGKKLENGTFLSPELSFDGRKILFAWVEPGEWKFTWRPESCYHIFAVNADGTGLAQLTDGPWNEFDPCWLPSGRIAFISERRGGFGRCHGHPVPTYTLFSMNAAGGEIVPLSYHETNEWQPSVTPDGRIIYTRWDYVDRGADIAHHPWVTTPDGRDPRAIHGNWSPIKQVRPYAEMDIRAIPGSPRYVAVAAPHHSQSFGSLVLIDPEVKDDDAMAQVRRLTPEALFPESETGAGVGPYGAPWPLSEDFYLCVYSYDFENYGIYVVDSFGNRELIYRDPQIGCMSPMPLRPRPAPPVLPDQVGPGAPVQNAGGAAPPQGMRTASGKEHPVGEFTLINVYDSQQPWPEGTRITALRIFQLLPKSTIISFEPHIGVAPQGNARALVGTVPVEADGSARFYAPAEVPLYFQALDERGMAVQSMRSVAYLHPGEKNTCQGCHEPRAQAPSLPAALVTALKRAASRPQPGPDGSNPFNYPRLVQGVLDRNCVACHQERKAADLSGRPVRAKLPGRDNTWTASYLALSQWGFWFSSDNNHQADPEHGGAITMPGQFGARASRLRRLLQNHYGLKLAEEDWGRLALWLDSNSDFYGAYEKEEEQTRGEVVRPKLE